MSAYACIPRRVPLQHAYTIMFDAKNLTDDQVASIKNWAIDGAQLADIQKHIEEDFKIRLTYMDVRFLVLDLGIKIRNLEEEASSEEVNTADEPTVEGSELTEDDIEVIPPTPQGSAPVRVTVDEIARPGVMASGRVTFADGQNGMWYVDEMGRLGIDPDTEGYRPTELDLKSFQGELQRVMEPR